LEEEGTVVALVFSLGRAQEILYELKKMQERKELDVGIPIYFDGKLAIRYTDLYIKDGLDVQEEMRDFLPQNLTFVDSASRSSVLEDTNKKIIVTTSGMGSYGPAQTYIPEYIARNGALIQFTGYTAEGTMGNRLKATQSGEMVEVGGLIIKKTATVEYTTEYSAHAKADEMIEFLSQFQNLKLILINHGELKTKNVFAERIAKEVKAKKVGLLGRRYFFRVNPYGLVKTLSTKFE
jgi:metallo-beta-lactamase family protein